MSRQHSKPKRRNKPYRGADAATGPHVTRISVGNETKAQTWWKDNKRTIQWRTALVLIAVLVSWIIYSFIN